MKKLLKTGGHNYDVDCTSIAIKLKGTVMFYFKSWLNDEITPYFSSTILDT